ncbi:MAG TPA: serine/threonine-protein kinase [Kofleriaceae bacterium]|nr:serine/threonine-protein kinase [Kofleriaceae bacterium]
MRPALAPRAARRSDDAIASGTRIGTWRTTGELGRGGMASVHAAVQLDTARHAAIKLAHRSALTDRYTAATFLREARIIREIHHPGVAEVYGSGRIDDRPYVVMELLDGVTLGTRIDAGPVMPRAEAIEILLELCGVLRAAHQAGIVHRDVKLDNVFLCARDHAPGQRVKLLDWGVAHVAGEPDPFRGLIAGTLTYVAPEQIRGDALTPAADVYALAVLAYHLLCRRPPFAARSELALLHMHLHAPPPRASAVWTQIPHGLDTLLHDMLAKQPADRPSLDAVEAVLRATLAAIAPARQPAEAAPRRPSHDVLGRPILPVPPLTAGWIAAAISLAVLALLISVL